MPQDIFEEEMKFSHENLKLNEKEVKLANKTEPPFTKVVLEEKEIMVKTLVQLCLSVVV